MAEAQGPLGEVALAATSLYVSDLDKAVAWYEDKLGLRPMTIGTDQHGYAAYAIGGAIVVLEPREAAMEAAEPGRESTTINLVVDRDPASVREDLVARGVACGALVPSPNFSSFLIRDLDGNRFYVTKPVTAEAKEALDDTSQRPHPS
jgi:catechol 2,3-dioxygenase-like lactoylglutathione lyase family enzyme